MTMRYVLICAYRFNVRVAVPAESNRLRTFRLLKSAEVEFEFFVIEINGGDCCDGDGQQATCHA